MLQGLGCKVQRFLGQSLGYRILGAFSCGLICYAVVVIVVFVGGKLLGI